MKKDIEGMILEKLAKTYKYLCLKAALLVLASAISKHQSAKVIRLRTITESFISSCPKENMLLFCPKIQQMQDFKRDVQNVSFRCGLPKAPQGIFLICMLGFGGKEHA